MVNKICINKSYLIILLIALAIIGGVITANQLITKKITTNSKAASDNLPAASTDTLQKSPNSMVTGILDMELVGASIPIVYKYTKSLNNSQKFAIKLEPSSQYFFALNLRRIGNISERLPYANLIPNSVSCILTDNGKVLSSENNTPNFIIPFVGEYNTDYVSLPYSPQDKTGTHIVNITCDLLDPTDKIIILPSNTRNFVFSFD